MREVRVTKRVDRRRVMGVLGVGRGKNAVYSARNMVRVFMLGGRARRRMEREVMGLRYRVVYVGAIAILVRFVVMLLNLNEWEEE